LSYQPDEAPLTTVYGLATNFLYNCHIRLNKLSPSMIEPIYDISGPSGSWLIGESGVKIPIHIRHSNFKLPRNSELPVIMIGPGTGVAPFRGFIQERAFEAKQNPEKKVGPMVLFFGCRREDQDF